MIDFRYHIVSLISVFLALAVGIALGAGPLKETIGDTLTGQVSSLRAEKESLRAGLDASAASLSHSEAFIDGTAGRLLSGTLADRRVAVVLLGDVSSGVKDGVDTRLQQSGASVSAHVQLTGVWTDPGQRTFRQALAGNLVSYLNPAPASGASVDEELAEALTQALAGADPAAPDKQSSSASILLELLTTGDSPLITVTGTVTTPADAIVVIAPSPTNQTGADATPPTDDVQKARLAVVAAAGSG
ncbi:MAG: copper transporter, partial [Actinobacteria bacterium]|nr:copper transporter [Actinomycetota bacterium]MCG2801552.1 copper transporter [Cellulomonas sp.]